ncbi:MAG: type II toxin-antitoxin system ParD family antitoxin [Chloroflexia bacterium]|nr:type II toxin-antitoxin system ParD family antitoxin [Chloroflexia bacterium]
MIRNASVSLGNHFAAFVYLQVDSGRFGWASDVIRAGLRLLEEHEARVQALRQALVGGEQSGQAERFDVEDFLRSQRQTSE